MTMSSISVSCRPQGLTNSASLTLEEVEAYFTKRQINDGFVIDYGQVSMNRFEEIPQELVEEAKKLASERGCTMVIYDVSDRQILNKALPFSFDKSKERDYKLDGLLGVKFYIDSWYHLLDMPSRSTYYDTITDSTSKVERHRKVRDLLYSLGFEESNWTDSWGDILSEDDMPLMESYYNRECSYRITADPDVILRVKPNLLIEMSLNRDSLRTYTFFYDPQQIIDILLKGAPVELKRE